MTKTIFALAAAGILGAAILPAHAMVPGTSATMQNGSTATTQQAQINKDRQLLRRDVRLGRKTDAARLRREINADERSISRAKTGGEQTPTARGMQSTPMTIPQAPSSQNSPGAQPNSPQNQNNQ